MSYFFFFFFLNGTITVSDAYIVENPCWNQEIVVLAPLQKTDAIYLINNQYFQQKRQMVLQTTDFLCIYKHEAFPQQQ